jgi:antitoxin component YwqK of YwqJK toxin-antitoxin module
MEEETTRDVSYHDNGQIACVVDKRNGKLHGYTRMWYPDGTLESEYPTVNGLVHGEVRFFSESGQLIGSYVLEHGCGTALVFSPSGNLLSEVDMVRGVPCGRQRVFYEDGRVMSETFRLFGKQVSRKKYLEAIKKDSSLPHYE